MPFWSKEESKLKMVVYFDKVGTKQIWYSPIKHNHLDDLKIISKMYTRLKERIKGYNKILIYDNKTNTLTHTIE